MKNLKKFVAGVVVLSGVVGWYQWNAPERELREQILQLARSYRAEAINFDQMADDVPWHEEEFREISRLKFGQAEAWAVKYQMSWEELLNDPVIRRDFPWVKPH